MSFAVALTDHKDRVVRLGRQLSGTLVILPASQDDVILLRSRFPPPIYDLS